MIRPKAGSFKQFLADLKADPILYHRHNDTVAILDQFGAIPNEEAILNWARTEGIRLIPN